MNLRWNSPCQSHYSGLLSMHIARSVRIWRWFLNILEHMEWVPVNWDFLNVNTSCCISVINNLFNSLNVGASTHLVFPNKVKGMLKIICVYAILSMCLYWASEDAWFLYLLKWKIHLKTVTEYGALVGLASWLLFIFPYIQIWLKAIEWKCEAFWEMQVITKIRHGRLR